MTIPSTSFQQERQTKMKVKSSQKKSRTDWDKLTDMPDADID
jgi:hypothetical protein